MIIGCGINGHPTICECSTMLSGVKHDEGKEPIGLLSKTAMFEIAKVLDFGQGKYDTHNWRKGMDWSRVSNAALRHLFKWVDGEDLDDETGLSHLAHAACCLMFLLEYQAKGLGKDDRYGKS